MNIKFLVHEMLEKQLEDEIGIQPFVIEFVSEIDKRENITGYEGIQLILEAYEPYKTEPSYHDAVSNALVKFTRQIDKLRPELQLENPKDEEINIGDLVLGNFSHQLPIGFTELVEELSPVIEKVITDGIANYLKEQDE